MEEVSTAQSILKLVTRLRVLQRVATVIYELKWIKQEAEYDSSERFHLFIIGCNS